MSDYLYIKLLSIPAVLIALTVHEYAHGRMALRLGDPTAQYMGRLSLNPLRHIDPLGAIMMLLVGFGWAKPVPVNPNYFKNPHKGMALTAMMGPLSNLIMAIITVPLYLLIIRFGNLLLSTVAVGDFAFSLLQAFVNFLYIFHTLNLSLMLFNLIPLPPLDGSRIIGLFLPQHIVEKLMMHERQIYYALLAWLFLGSYFFRYLLALPVVASSGFLTATVKIFSLTEWLGDAVLFLSEQLINLFSLIPFLSV